MRTLYSYYREYVIESERRGVCSMEVFIYLIKDKYNVEVKRDGTGIRTVPEISLSRDSVNFVLDRYERKPWTKRMAIIWYAKMYFNSVLNQGGKMIASLVMFTGLFLSLNAHAQSDHRDVNFYRTYRAIEQDNMHRELLRLQIERSRYMGSPGGALPMREQAPQRPGNRNQYENPEFRRQLHQYWGQ